jgi:diacylglycerol kinase family enzyme
MRRVALIYNPASGQPTGRRTAQIADVVAVLRGAGVDVKVIETESSASAGAQAQEAVSDGCDTILACGGDGTVHEVMQGLVGGSAALGVIPMGTANALAADLGVPASGKKAAKVLLDASPVRISVGHLFYRDDEGDPRSRYFVVAAGVGVDAHFFSRLDSRMKQRFGYAAYLVAAFRMWAVHDFPLFSAIADRQWKRCCTVARDVAAAGDPHQRFRRGGEQAGAWRFDPKRDAERNWLQHAQPLAIPAIHAGRDLSATHVLERD